MVDARFISLYIFLFFSSLHLLLSYQQLSFERHTIVHFGQAVFVCDDDSMFHKQMRLLKCLIDLETI